MTQIAVTAIEKLVLAIAEKAAKSAKNLSEQLEALRVLAPYYAALTKHRAPQSVDESDEITINSLQNAVRKAEEPNGRTVSGHQRRRAGQNAVQG